MTTYTNSIQQGTVTIAATATTGTSTLGTTIVGTAWLIYQGFTTADLGTTDLNSNDVRLSISGQVVTATVGSAAVGTITVNFVVIDATSSLITSAQYGTTSLAAATSNTTNITSVDTSLSEVFYLGSTTPTSSGSVNTTNPNITLTSATVVTTTLGSLGSCTSGWVVVTFAAAAIQSIQRFINTFSSANTTDDTTITGVTVANALISWQNSISTVSSPIGSFYSISLTSTTNARATRTGTTTTSRTVNFAIVEFAAGVLNQAIQSATIALASVTSNTATLSPTVNIANAFCIMPGWSLTGTNANQKREIFPAIALTNGSTVTATKNTAGTTTSTPGFQVIEFANSGSVSQTLNSIWFGADA